MWTAKIMEDGDLTPGEILLQQIPDEILFSIDPNIAKKQLESPKERIKLTPAVYKFLSFLVRDIERADTQNPKNGKFEKPILNSSGLDHKILLGQLYAENQPLFSKWLGRTRIGQKYLLSGVRQIVNSVIFIAALYGGYSFVQPHNFKLSNLFGGNTDNTSQPATTDKTPVEVEEPETPASGETEAQKNARLKREVERRRKAEAARLERERLAAEERERVRLREEKKREAEANKPVQGGRDINELKQYQRER